MLQYNPLQYLPRAEDLPDLDDTPVDNELQILVASLLGAIVAWVWSTWEILFSSLLGLRLFHIAHPDRTVSELRQSPFVASTAFLSFASSSHRQPASLSCAGHNEAENKWAKFPKIPVLPVQFL